MGIKKMKNKPGKPELMKKMNISSLYESLIVMRSATRAELSERTKISTTTIRSLLDLLIANEEVVELELDESSGGRRAQRYALNTHKNLMLSLYFSKGEVHYKISDLLGAIHKTGTEQVDNSDKEILTFVGKCCAEWKICIIGLGVPGVVEKNKYYVIDRHKQVVYHNIGEQIAKKFSLRVILENDLNAIALGYAIRYGLKRNYFHMGDSNIIYLYFENAISAGIIADGKIIRGANQFAGELGFLPIENDKIFNDLLIEMEDSASSDKIASVIARVIIILFCVTNPSHIIMDGKVFKMNKVTIKEIESKMREFAEQQINIAIKLPVIEVCEDDKPFCLLGLTYLTLQEILKELPLKE